MLNYFKKNWWLVLLRGIAAVLFGLTAVLFPGITLLSLAIMLGIYFLVDGIFFILGILTARQEYDQWGWVLAEGILSLVAGVVVLAWPQITLTVLLYLAAGWALATGILEIVAAVGLRKELTNEWLMGLGGLISLLLGILLIIQPQAGLLSAIWFLGGYAVFFGVLLIILSLKLRSLPNETLKESL